VETGQVEHDSGKSRTGGVRSDALRIRPARAEDWSAVADLLTAANLVPLDASAQFGLQYAVAEDPGGAIVGVGGYERHGTDILLRSVAVARAWQSCGVGHRLVANRLEDAASRGYKSAYLLTDTAEAWWERHGFAAIARTEAPPAVTQSQEWSHACPASATAMLRRL
jgi:amino-acid N-acetyltransferase